jgi:ABC-type Fe3+/spermidine/putrescine transport system ATPase subunit
MAHGEILQVGRPAELYRHPASALVAEFFGSINWIRGMAHGNNRVETELGPLWVADSRHCHGAVIVGVRPEDVHLQRSSNENENRIEGKVRNSVFLGDQIVCEIDVRGKILIAKGSPNDGEPSDTVFVYLPRERLVVFSDRVPSDSLG